MHLAAFNGHKECVLSLLALKGDPMMKNQKGQLAHEVASRDDIANVLKTFRPENGRTLMHFACEHGSLALVEWIIANRFGNAVTAWDRNITAPLHIAAEKGFYEICRALLMAGADRNIYDKQRRLPIDVAANDAVRHLLTTFEIHRVRRTTDDGKNHVADDDDDDEDDDGNDNSDVSSSSNTPSLFAAARTGGGNAAELPTNKRLTALGSAIPRVSTPELQSVGKTAAAAAAVSNDVDPFDAFVSDRKTFHDSPARVESPALTGSDLISFNDADMYSNYASALYASPEASGSTSPALLNSMAKKSSGRAATRGSWSVGVAPMFDPFGGDGAALASPSASPSLAPRQHQLKQQQQADNDDDTHARQPTRASSAVTFGSLPIVAAAAPAPRVWSPFDQQK